MTLIGPSLTGISKSRYFLTLNISETTRDRATVTIEHQYEVIGSLSNGDIFNDLQGPITRVSRLRHFPSRVSYAQVTVGQQQETIHKLLNATTFNYPE